jgi:hypothetical protein
MLEGRQSRMEDRMEDRAAEVLGAGGVEGARGAGGAGGTRGANAAVAIPNMLNHHSIGGMFTSQQPVLPVDPQTSPTALLFLDPRYKRRSSD